MRIVIGTKGSIKIAAVHEACVSLGIKASLIAVETASGVNAQPIEEDEVLRGARNRARAARAACPEATLAIGIENGLFYTDGAWLDAALIVILTSDGEEHLARSPAVTFPTDIVEEACRRGFETTTAGAILAEHTGCNPADPHAFLTGGAKTRKDLLVETLVKGVTR